MAVSLENAGAQGAAEVGLALRGCFRRAYYAIDILSSQSIIAPDEFTSARFYYGALSVLPDNSLSTRVPLSVVARAHIFISLLSRRCLRAIDCVRLVNNLQASYVYNISVLVFFFSVFLLQLTAWFLLTRVR